MGEEILQEAKNIIDNPDYIVNVYDLRFVWVSDKLCEFTGYRKEELINTRASKLLTLSPQEVARLVKERLLKKEGETKLKGKDKNGKDIEATVQSKVFNHNLGLYIVSKLIKYS